ncbi:DUF1223 domain-containing protein [Mucilaginibacter gynuensis]|uniref:DUF1223 domain-containing protein n=1 Tax=Mucilaginibacter gynuensis TaxID=1302236 RepID=A0ABP8GKA0_9SPHI
MKNIKLYSLLCLVTILLTASAFKNGGHAEYKENKKQTGFAVIELFTSEGCSSCPAADAVLAKIQQEKKDQQVYILAYHVDYWNRLGWKDAFSKHAYSERQYKYTGWIKGASVYTPQVVVNGKTEFVGSQEGTLRNAITASLKEQHNTRLLLNGLKVDKSGVTVNYEAENAGIKDVLLFALVQKNARTVVKSGENEGRTLPHVQIVRELQQVTADKASGSITLPLPTGFNTGGYEVIGLVQNSANGGIEAASKVAFATNGTMAVIKR